MQTTVVRIRRVVLWRLIICPRVSQAIPRRAMPMKPHAQTIRTVSVEPWKQASGMLMEHVIILPHPKHITA